MVVRTVGWLLGRRLVGLTGLGQGPDVKDVEIAVLRHQLVVLGRRVKRPQYGPIDRLLLAWLARLLLRDRPATLLGWHRELVAGRWSYPHTGTGFGGVDPEVVEVVLGLARENPRWE